MLFGIVLLKPIEKEMVLPAESVPVHNTGFNMLVEELVPELKLKNRTFAPVQGCATQY